MIKVFNSNFVCCNILYNVIYSLSKIAQEIISTKFLRTYLIVLIYTNFIYSFIVLYEK